MVLFLGTWYLLPRILGALAQRGKGFAQSLRQTINSSIIIKAQSVVDQGLATMFECMHATNWIALSATFRKMLNMDSRRRRKIVIDLVILWLSLKPIKVP